MGRLFRRTDIVAGTVLVVLALLSLFEAINYDLGTLRSMGPGYFPVALSLVILACGIATIAGGFADRHDILALPPGTIRAMSATLASMCVFALTVERFGLIPAVFTTTLIASLASKEARPAGILTLATGLSVAIYLIFSLGLNFQVPAFNF